MAGAMEQAILRLIPPANALCSAAPHLGGSFRTCASSQSCAAARAAAGGAAAAGMPVACVELHQRPAFAPMGASSAQLSRQHQVLQGSRVSVTHATPPTRMAVLQPSGIPLRSFFTSVLSPRSSWRAVQEANPSLPVQHHGSVAQRYGPDDGARTAGPLAKVPLPQLRLLRLDPPCTWQRPSGSPLCLQPTPQAMRALSTSTAPCCEPRRPVEDGTSLQPQHQQDLGHRNASSKAQDSKAGNSVAAAPAARPAADPVYNLPNAVSVARLVSGPVIGVWLLQGHYEVATVALVISGASDWLDGYLARRMGATSVFGSYLDPLADKVLIGCVAAALLANGSMPLWLGGVVVGRDLLLVSGAFVFRLRGFGWRWPGREAFFRTADLPAPQAPAADTGTAAAGSGASGDVSGGAAGQGVSFMRPLLISKANTVLQLVLLGGYLTRGMYGWPDGEPVAALELATAATTVASLAAYASIAARGNLFK